MAGESAQKSALQAEGTKRMTLQTNFETRGAKIVGGCDHFYFHFVIANRRLT